MEDLEAKGSPNIKESTDLSVGGEDREGFEKIHSGCPE